MSPSVYPILLLWVLLSFVVAYVLVLRCCEYVFCMSMDLFILCVACLTVFCKLFGATICNMVRCVCYFVVNYDGDVVCGWRCSIG